MNAVISSSLLPYLNTFWGPHLHIFHPFLFKPVFWKWPSLCDSGKRASEGDWGGGGTLASQEAPGTGHVAQLFWLKCFWPTNSAVGGRKAVTLPIIMWILHVVSFICCTLRRDSFEILQANLVSFLSCSFGNMYIFLCVCVSGGNMLEEIEEIMMELKFKRSNDYLYTWYILSIFQGFLFFNLNVAYTCRYESN